MIDMLNVTFEKDETNRDLSALCVASMRKDKFYVRNMIVGEKAERIYDMLTKAGDTDGNS